MADNFLERHREEYEIRKAAWLKKKKLFMKSGKKQKPQTQMPPSYQSSRLWYNPC